MVSMGEWLSDQANQIGAGVNRIDTLKVSVKVGADAPKPAGTSEGKAVIEPPTINREAMVGFLTFFVVAGILWRFAR